MEPQVERAEACAEEEEERTLVNKGLPAYARTALLQLVARIRFVLRPAMLAQFDKSQCFSFPDKPAQVRRFFAFIAPGYAGASDHDKSIWICTLRYCGCEP